MWFYFNYSYFNWIRIGETKNIFDRVSIFLFMKLDQA